MTHHREDVRDQAALLLTVPGVAVSPRVRAALLAARGHAASSAGAVASLPRCLSCDTDDDLVYPEYREQETLFQGAVRPAWVRYCCTRCGASRQHAVPKNWRPPGWFGCT